jgi:hypothetical protein
MAGTFLNLAKGYLVLRLGVRYFELSEIDKNWLFLGINAIDKFKRLRAKALCCASGRCLSSSYTA